MSYYTLQRTQFLPISLSTAWKYFSHPANLREITPPQLNMVMTGPTPAETFAGQIITYTISPILGIPLHWMTEITHLKPHEYFIDEQRFGPYSFWHHLHTFREVEGGVEMTDLVHYKLPFGFLGDLVHLLFVRKQLTTIFNFRQSMLERRFGKS